jgi:hypothetical protein
MGGIILGLGVQGVVLSSAAMRSSSIGRGLPRRNSSCKPSMRRATKRQRRLPTVAFVVAKRRATGVFGRAPAHARTILCPLVS